MYKKGYKAFHKTDVEKQGKCRDFLYEEGKEYEISGNLELCANGFHFCKDLVLTFEYYGSDTNVYCFAEVEALGDVIYEEPNRHKCCTSKIKIVRFLSDEEVLGMIDGDSNSGYSNSGDSNSGNSNSGNSNSGDSNSGNRNSGYSNSGNRNSGYRNSGNSNSGYSNSGDSNSGNSNSGNRNSGYSNSGNSNSGNRNSGYSNSGNRNSGYRNSGNSNSGDRNSGDRNSGDWNSCDKESGFFNTKTPETINVFNKPCPLNVWNSAKKPVFLFFNLIEGKTYKESFQAAYERASNEDVELLKALPNFDANVFFEISGIRVK